MKRPCQVFRSPNKLETYLYVDASEGLKRVPESLLKQFGEPELAMSLVLHSGRRLARVDVQQVLDALTEQGYFLQMPPPPGMDVESLLHGSEGVPQENVDAE